MFESLRWPVEGHSMRAHQHAHLQFVGIGKHKNYMHFFLLFCIYLVCTLLAENNKLFSPFSLYFDKNIENVSKLLVSLMNYYQFH